MADCPHLGDVKNRYLSVAKGDATKQSDSDGEDENVDANGEKVLKSGGKIEIVKSADGVGNIRERFGSIGKGGWKKKSAEGQDTNQVDGIAVNSARNLFKNFENQNKDENKSFNRPTSRKVRDAKELMEMRKKATYGDGEELPQDGVIKKSVVLDENELGKSPKKEAFNVYKQLENSQQQSNDEPLQKPKTRLMSDNEAKLQMNKRSDSLSGSDTGDMTAPTIDVNGDVSGYEGSDSPCSPTSTLSDDYNSDTQKDIEKVELNDDVIANNYDDDEEVYDEPCDEVTVQSDYSAGIEITTGPME